MDQEAKGKMQLQMKEKAMIMISKKNPFPIPSPVVSHLHQHPLPKSAPQAISLLSREELKFPPRVAASCPSQRQGSPELVEFVTDVLKREGVAVNDRKRRRDTDQEETTE